MVKFVLYVFLFLFVCVCGLSIYGSRLKSPYTLSFYFGPKGVGKSSYFCKLMLQDLKKGYIVYTDIPDINIPGVRQFTCKDLSDFMPEANSSLYIDEGGIRINKRNWKLFTDGEREFYKLQRHFKCKVAINSQSWDVDLTVRELCDRMFLCSNLFGCILLLRPINRSIVLTQAGENESRIADQLKFASFFNWKFVWLPKYHKYFDSFSIPDRQPLPYSEVMPKSLKEEIERISDD